MKIASFFDHFIDNGEVNSGEVITEPGQSFTTREIYERFLVTGRVEGVRNVSYDDDNVVNNFDLDNPIEEDPIDITDIQSQIDKLYQMRAERMAKAQKEELAKRTASQGASAASDEVSSPKGE